MTTDPWATDRPTDPKPLTRDDLVLMAAQTVHIAACIAGTEVKAWRDLPLFVRDQYIGDAYAALEAAYPELRSSAALDALPAHAVIIGPGGVAWERVVTPGNTLVRDPDRCWARQGEKARSSSADLVRSGSTYVLVYRVAA